MDELFGVSTVVSPKAYDPERGSTQNNDSQEKNETGPTSTMIERV